MFGFSFGELVVLLIVGMVVIGPKELPKVLRRVGQWAGKLRRMASDIRAQSGIDEVLRGEGIAEDIAEIRKLARGEMESVTRAARVPALGAATTAIRSDLRNDPYAPQQVAQALPDELIVHREREYPREGADSYGALPDTALVYVALPRSPLARDPLYRLGDPDGALPPEESSTPASPAELAAPPDSGREPSDAPDQPHHDA